MIENTEQSGEPRQSVTRTMIAEMLMKNFEKLPEGDQKFFTYAPLYLAGNAGLAGLISNSLYRRVLNVQEARLSSSLPMLVLPFLTTTAMYQVVISNPLLAGDLNCPSCSVIRGALIGVVFGGLYPIVLALPANLGLAARYSSAPLPQKGNIMRYCMDVSKPIFRKMMPVIVIQAAFGGYMGSRHFQIYIKLAQTTSSKGEELGD
ncbi:transmembrane protein 126A [Austrofundulus limnaeus]|uniref:Transmembrane protein 126A n=1 Tax=Austrofundulus limnaeus TaxID=52670 RepID=A0A2I4AU53_AUSLI|nr:PREDICTED: transmembrane protein 126A-like [Austrofundulus limnaeus]